MASPIKFSIVPPRGDRVHHICQEDVIILLNRLPPELYGSLRAIHFNDQSRCRTLGYVNQGRTDIAICAQPPRLSLTRALRGKQKPQHFGAKRGEQWPRLAIRRFLLYDVFLHELGHLQIIDAKRPSKRLRFAREKLAQEFAEKWCRRLWANDFDHPDPVHNPPSREELAESQMPYNACPFRSTN